MKKYIVFLSVLLALLIAISAWNAGNQAAVIRPTLVFQENRVVCGLHIKTDTEDEFLHAVIRLWENGRCVATWRETGIGFLQFSETVPAVPGSTYCLTVRVNISGRKLPQMSVENVYE